MSPERYRTIARWALGGQAGIVVTGAMVRLTGSGLGCSDWPGCESDRFVPAWSFHDWVEYGNRLLSFVVVATAAVALLGARRLRPRRPDLVWLAGGLVAGVVVQALLGAVLVLFELDPRLTILHFLLSIVLVSDAVVLLHRARLLVEPRPVVPVARSQGWSAATHLLALSALVVVVTGTVVTGSGPHGGDDRAARLGFALDDVARIHAGSMWVFLAVLAGTAALLWRGGAPDELKRPVTLLGAATGAQAVLGYLQYALGVPAGLVALHVVGALVVWSAALTTLLRTRSVLAPEPTVATRAAAGDGTIGQVPILSER